jgi:hypothetical protein
MTILAYRSCGHEAPADCGWCGSGGGSSSHNRSTSSCTGTGAFALNASRARTTPRLPRPSATSTDPRRSVSGPNTSTRNKPGPSTAAEGTRALPFTWDTVGVAYHHLGRHADAVATYRQALALYRDRGHRYFNSGR